MKTLATVAALAIGLAVFAFNENQQNKLLQQQIENYDRQVSLLLTQIETRSLQNIETDRQMRSIQTELAGRDSQIASLTYQLDLAQQQTDPDYEELEAQIRTQLKRELASNGSSVSTDPRVSLIKQLRELDPMAIGEVYAMNAQYGEFLGELDVSEDRLEVVINALSNMLSDQNQARAEIALAMQASPAAATQEEMYRQILSIASPEAQLEALSYDLSDSELEAFSEFQERRQNSSAFFGRAGASPVGSGLIRGGLIQNGPGQTEVIQLMPAMPIN